MKKRMARIWRHKRRLPRSPFCLKILISNTNTLLKSPNSVRGGENEKRIKWLYSKGHANKEDYMKALQSYQEYLGEIESSQRDTAASFSEQYRYY